VKKLNLAAGKDIRKDFINHDIAQIDGIDIVHDLNIFPWPWKDNSFDEIIAIDILEHLDDFVKTFDEIYRILAKGGIVKIRVPYWNHSSAYIDPTHKRGFHEDTFKFFIPNTPYRNDRDYYSQSNFELISQQFIVTPFYPYFSIPGIRIIYVKNKFFFKALGFIGCHISNLIAALRIELKKI